MFGQGTLLRLTSTAERDHRHGIMGVLVEADGR